MNINSKSLGIFSGHCLSHFAFVFTFVFLIVIEHAAHIGGYISQSQHSSDTHRLAKRMDLEACLGQFDVHNNTIIRTGESQAIGGKYLQGLELDTMDECQRLCCETESCDVYIFEDKNGGYCYLFECGPPHNFHCKFTRHANYTSAVLTPIKLTTTPRPPPPPNTMHLSTSNLSQQERELTSLKVKPDTREKLAELAAGISSATNFNNLPQKQFYVGQKMESNFPPKTIVNTTVQQCSRFQFSCHSGECIAVYNACDGIPQCEDGSDEGPECLGATANNGVQLNSKGNIETTIVNSVALDSTVGQKYRSSHETSQQQLQNLQQQQTQVAQPIITTPVVNNREDVGAWANRKVAVNTQQNEVITTGDLDSHIFTHKNGLQLAQNPDVSTVNDGHINVGAIDMNTGVANYPNSNANLNPLYTGTIQRSGVYIPQAGIAQQNEGIYGVPQQQILNQQGHIYVPTNVNWAQQQQQQQQQPQQQLAQGSSYAINPLQQAEQHFTQQQETKVAFMPAPIFNDGKPQIPQQNSQIPEQSVASHRSTVAVTNNHNIVQGESNKDSTKKALERVDTVPNSNENNEYTDYEDQSTEAPKKKPHKHRKTKTKASTTNAVGKELPTISKDDLTDDPVQQSMAQQKQQDQKQSSNQVSHLASPLHEQYKMIHENLAMEFRDHDGQSDRPGGAVLSLTLGLLVTGLLIMILVTIGCRTVGRRSRRLGGKFSHEADFLVNGMYL